MALQHANQTESRVGGTTHPVFVDRVGGWVVRRPWGVSFVSFSENACKRRLLGSSLC